MPPEDIPTEFCCPISLGLMMDPVLTVDGHTFDRDCITRWLLHNNTNPLTHSMLQNKSLVSNRVLWSMIQAYCATHHLPAPPPQRVQPPTLPVQPPILPVLPPQRVQHPATRRGAEEDALFRRLRLLSQFETSRVANEAQQIVNVETAGIWRSRHTGDRLYQAYTNLARSSIGTCRQRRTEGRGAGLTGIGCPTARVLDVRHPDDGRRSIPAALLAPMNALTAEQHRAVVDLAVFKLFATPGDMAGLPYTTVDFHRVLQEAYAERHPAQPRPLPPTPRGIGVVRPVAAPSPIPYVLTPYVLGVLHTVAARSPTPYVLGVPTPTVVAPNAEVTAAHTDSQFASQEARLRLLERTD